MAKVRKDTAWRAVTEAFAQLRGDAVIDFVKAGAPAPGVALAIRLEISTADDQDIRTSGAPAVGSEGRGGDDAKVHRRRGT